ncbi:BTAD domain-containing putative transcriptional regulator [Streptomyces pathocidini]|uniref:BTAD domain-containing putative transcriptional regulator n=1 Tax=Streptomyces pathocidini TaxID=1650571 RepID=UPI00340FDD11
MSGNSEGLGRRIQSLRKQSRMSQQELASKAGMSTRALRDIENGRVRRPQLRTVQSLTGALGLPHEEVGDLLAAAREAPARGAAKPRFLILGTLSVQRGQRTVPVTTPMLRRLLGLLVLKHPEPATHQEIIDILWPSGPPKSCQSLIHTYVSQARQLLEPESGPAPVKPVVERIPSGYVLRAGEHRTDLGCFDDLVAKAKQAHTAGRSEAAYESLAQALRHWRGPVLADVDPMLRQHPTAVAAAERRIEAALLHADLALQLHCPEQALSILWDLVGDEPLHERLHARLILALAGCGEQAAALKVFNSFRERLDEELGIAPSEEIREAHIRVLRQQLPRPEPAGFDPAPRAAPRPAQLPAETRAYVGRGRQMRELDGLLSADPAEQAPVVTVVGPPGVGKTALALHWAHARRERFPDGQLFVNLRGYAPLPALRPVDVLARFLRALGAPPDQVPSGEEEAAALYRTLLAGRRMLIVLDNAADVEQVRPLIPGEGGCRVVITSRSRLAGLVASDGTRRLGLEVLSADEAQTLLSRVLGAERVVAEPESVAKLARLCGGLPLAIRIAAANLTVHASTGIADYCAELERGDLLGGLQVEGDERSAIRAAFDLSYLALPEPAQRMFRLLGSAPGSDVTAEGAAALAGVSAAEAGRLLRGLADAHLVQEQATGRFAMHDLLRSYARESAGGTEGGAGQRRLLDWYVDRAEAAVGSDSAEAAEWLEGERENLVNAVLHASRAGFQAVVLRLAEALYGYLSLGMYTADCLAVATAGLAAATAVGDVRAQAAAQLRRADCHWAQGRNAQAREVFADALELARRAGWSAGQATALRKIGAAHQENGAMRQASDYLSQARDLTGQADGAGAAEDAMNLGLICWKLGRLREAVEHYAHAAALFRAGGSLCDEAISHTNMGIIHRALGRPRDAIRMLGEALPVHAQNGNKGSEIVALSCLSTAHTDLGDHTTGESLARVALDAAQATPDRRLEANAFYALGAAQAGADEPDSAADSYRQALRVAEVVNDRYPQVSALIGLATIEQRLGEPRRALRTVDRAIGIAREAEFRMLEAGALNVLACVHVGLGDAPLGLEVAKGALALHRETGHRPGEARCRLVLGWAYAALGARGEAFGQWRAGLRLFRAMGLPGYGELRPYRRRADGAGHPS